MYIIWSAVENYLNLTIYGLVKSISADIKLKGKLEYYFCKYGYVFKRLQSVYRHNAMMMADTKVIY